MNSNNSSTTAASVPRHRRVGIRAIGRHILTATSNGRLHRPSAYGTFHEACQSEGLVTKVTKTKRQKNAEAATVALVEPSGFRAAHTPKLRAWQRTTRHWLAAQRKPTAPELNESQLTELKQVFASLNDPGTDELDINQLETALRVCGFGNASRITAERMFQSLGKSITGTDRLSFAQFAHLLFNTRLQGQRLSNATEVHVAAARAAVVVAIDPIASVPSSNTTTATATSVTVSVSTIPPPIIAPSPRHSDKKPGLPSRGLSKFYASPSSSSSRNNGNGAPTTTSVSSSSSSSQQTASTSVAPSSSSNDSTVDLLVLSDDPITVTTSSPSSSTLTIPTTATSAAVPLTTSITSSSTTPAASSLLSPLSLPLTPRGSVSSNSRPTSSSSTRRGMTPTLPSTATISTTINHVRPLTLLDGIIGNTTTRNALGTRGHRSQTNSTSNHHVTAANVHGQPLDGVSFSLMVLHFKRRKYVVTRSLPRFHSFIC
jgi:hypothetical protein